MKTTSYKIFTLALVFGLLLSKTIGAQGIQRVFGTDLDNSFTKVIRSGVNYYVLGRDEPTNGALTRATVTRLNALGEHQWTLSLDIASVWNDAVLTPGGNLLVVGNTLPLGTSSQSLMGLVTPAGAFSWVRSYSVPGREWFNRVVLNPMPVNGAFPYYVLGGQWDPAGNANWDDIVLLTVSESGNFGWKKIYTGLFGSTDDEFSRDLEVLPNGDLILAGNLGTSGVVFRADNAGELIGSAGPEGLSFSFADVAQTSGGFYAVGSTFPAVVAHLMKFDNDLLVLWQIIIPELTAISQVWTDSGGKIYVIGRATVGGLNRGVLLKYEEVGGNPSLLWMKYLEYTDLSYNGGSAWYMPPSQIAFADGREREVGFGGDCAFFSISDLSLTTCMTETAASTQLSADLSFFSPLPPDVQFYDTPPATSLTSSSLNWQQDNACPPPCVAAFIIQKVGNCFYFQTNNSSSGPPPLTYQWNFGDPASGANNTSTAQNPDHVFSGCGTYTVCLTVTGVGCTASVCHTVTATDITPPSMSCPSSVNYQCADDVPLLGSVVVTATDNCTPPQSITITATESVNGILPCNASIVRTWVAQDLCGNTWSCSQTIIVNDDQAPVLLNCPPSVVNVQCAAQVPPPGVVSATDNCAPAPSLTFSEVINGILPCNASIVRTWVAEDACGNTSACTQTILVNDTQAPVLLNCPPSVVNVQCAAQVPPPGVVSATDNCAPAPSLTFSEVINGILPCNASIVRTWVAEDACGNTSACTQTIFVNDTQAPVLLNCPPSVVNVQCAEDVPPPGVVPATDNCAPAPSLTFSEVINGILPCNASIVRTWVAEDVCGNTSACTQTIFVNDTQAPVLFNCPPNFTVNTNPGVCYYTGMLPKPTVTDNCMPAPVMFCFLVTPNQSIPITPQTQFPKGDNTITCYAEDACGNQSQSCSFIMTVRDMEPPMITCPTSLSVMGVWDNNGQCKAVVNGLAPMVTDNCPMWTVAYSITGATTAAGPNDASGTNFMQGLSTVTYTVTDMGGNSATCSFTVTVECPPQGELNLSCGVAVVTCFSGLKLVNGILTVDQTAPVIALFDVRDPAPTAPLGNAWTTAPKQMFQQGDAQNCGQVFGLAIDNNGVIFTTASTIFGDATNIPGFTWGPGGPGAIYSFTYTSGAWVWNLFTTLPNGGSGLGNITYDKTHDQFFVTNFEDGMIYRIPNSPNPPWTSYQHTGATTFNASHPNFATLGKRLWGIGYNPYDGPEGRVYFARWNEDNGLGRFAPAIQNEIRSIGLDNAGNFLASSDEKHEIWMPNWSNTTYSNPVSDIEFSESGDMVVAEKVMLDDIGFATTLSPGTYAHRARIFQYQGSSSSGWSTGQQIYIGNVNSYDNSAGGVDYGYEDLDNASGQLTGCDGLIWGTGDALMYNGQNNFNNSTNYVYGIGGMPASGNTTSGSGWVESTSLYIDLDGVLTNIEKLQIGDVDIYNCPCPANPDFPCDSVMVMYEPTTLLGSDTCCYSIDLKNLVTTQSLTKICANLNTAGWIFNTSPLLASGWMWDQVGSNTLCFKPQSGPIPYGQLQDVLTFCLVDTTTGPPPPPAVQQITFDWYSGNDIVCQDTILTECDPPIIYKDTCLIIDSLMADCFGNSDVEYCMTFTVTNLSNMPAYGLVLGSLPAGFSYGLCGCGGTPYGAGGWLFSGFPIIPANSTQTFCVKIIANSPVLSPTTVCFNASLEFLNACCTAPKNWCVELLPCCDPCTNTAVTLDTLGGDCCYAIDFEYDCDFGYYTHVDFEILTPGVYFGWHANATGYTFCNPTTPTYVCVQPGVGGTIPSGTINNLFSFCLTDINMPSEVPQMLQVTYWTTGSNGQDSIACDTILTLNCEYKSDTCLFITDETIRCIPDSMKYEITVTVLNMSNPNFTATDLMILGPPTISPNPIAFSTPISNGQSSTVTFCYTPTPWPDADGKLELIYRLKNSTLDSCCNGGPGLIDTLMLPPCDTCKCGTYSDMSYRPAQGAPNFSAMCGDTLFAQCQGSIPWTFGGNFLCMGDSCPSQTPMFWTLTGPTGVPPQSGSMVATPGFNISLPPSYFSNAGMYDLSLFALCGTDTCHCDFKILVPECPCCIDSLAFANAIANFEYFGTLGNCTVSVNGTGLSDCMQVTWFWGDGSSTGPVGDATPVSHTYTNGTGDYEICYLIEELDLNGMVCWEYLDCDTVYVICDTCICNMPDLELTQNGVNYQLYCTQGAPTPVIPCPAGDVFISGFFGCVTPSGEPCIETPVTWSLSGPNGPIANGTASNYMQFIFFAAQVSAPGTYSLTLSTLCPGAMDSCICTVRWIRDNPWIWAKPRVFLQGPYVSATQLMNDNLRVSNLIPLEEPYGGLTGFTHVGGGGDEFTTPAILAVSGSDAIVDWVFLELRSAEEPALVVATHSALVQRDGDVVDVDGVSPVPFDVPAGPAYYLAVRHRNHLGVQLGAESLYPVCQALEKDFTNLPPEEFYEYNGLNPAQRLISGRYTLWAGNGRIDNQLKYNGSNNDRTAILSVVGLATPNATVPGYLLADYNLDGVVKYNGSANDRNILLGNVGIATPSAIIEDQRAR